MTTARLVRVKPARAPQLAALRIAYSDLATIAASLDEPESWRPTRCTGWVVRDLLHHLLGDAQRALVALSTPAAGPADVDAVGWWAGRRDDHRDLRAERAIASVWGWTQLVLTFVETTRAVVTAAGGLDVDDLVATQGHVLRVDDLLVTLAVEAAVHHLDLVADLQRPGPRPEPLRLVRATLDGLLGFPAPPEWADERWALVGTGREPPGGAERRVLGAAALPLLG